VLEYREIKDKNLQIRKRERVFTKQSFFVEGKRYIYEVNHPDIYYLNAIPLKKSFRILDE
jgi:hypothetical protein